MSATKHLEAIARELTVSGAYRVLRRLQRRTIVEPNDGTPTRLGFPLDIETMCMAPVSRRYLQHHWAGHV